MNVENGREHERARADGTTAVASLSHDSTASGCPARHAAFEKAARLSLDRAPPLEGAAECHLIGIFEVAADGQATRES